MQVSPHSIRTAALFVGIAGLGLVVLLSAIFEPQEISLRDIDSSMEGKAIRGKATVASSFKVRNVILLELYDGRKFPAVKFSPDESETGALQKNSIVEFDGKVERYNGQMEIVIGRVRKVA